MDIEKLARKLEPLRPKQVRHWLRVRDTAEPELRALIDQEIAHVAQQVLGDHRKKLLLSLPPRQRIAGAIHLGTVQYEQPKWPCGLRKGELLQNLAIFGRSGAGKTNVTFHILKQLVDKRVPFLYLDWKRTARHLIPQVRQRINVYTPGRSLSPLPFNPFIAPPGLEVRVYMAQVIDVLADAFTLGDGAKSIVQKALKACRDQGLHKPGVVDVLAAIRATPETDRARGWRISAERAVSSLASADLGGADGATQADLVRKLTEESTVIELDALDQSGRKFLIPLLCHWLFHARLAARAREQLALVIFVEEAHHVLYRDDGRTRESLMNTLLRQCREIGIGMVVVDQHPHLLSSAALGNTYTSICLNQKDPADINKAAALSLVDSSDKRLFSALPVGQAVVKLQDRWYEPFVIQFPLIDIEKGVVTDRVLEQYVKNDCQSEVLRSLSRERRRDRIGSSDRFIFEDEFLLMYDVAHNEEDGVDARYDRLHMSAYRGTKAKKGLVDRGWLNEDIVKIGRTRRTMLHLTDRANELLGASIRNIAGASPVHEYWKHYYAARMIEDGFAVLMESPRPRGGSGRIDILAHRKGERVAIEIETGKSDVVGNVRKNLRAGVGRIVVVATDSAAFGRVSRQLAAAGLVIPRKIQVTLRDQFWSRRGSPD